MSKRKSLNSGMVITVLVFSTVIMTWLFTELNFFSRMELASFDHRVAVFRSDKAIHKDIIIVQIDDKSLQEMSSEFGRWPWPRSAYTDILEFFSLAKAQALAFDILFTEIDDPESDNALINASKKSGIAVHAMQLLQLSEVNNNIQAIPQDFIDLHQIKSIDFKGLDYNDSLLPIEGLYQASRDVGYLEIVPDRDGVYRRIRLFSRYNEQAVFPALASSLVIPLISDADDFFMDDNLAIIGDTQIPLDGNGQYLINPSGELNIVPAHQVFSAMRQIKSGETENLILNPKDFEQKIIILAGTAIGLLDVKSTAISNKEPGVYLHAYTISNILEKDFLVPVSSLVTLLLAFIFSLIVTSSVLLMSSLFIAAIIPIFITIIYISFVYFSFSNNYLLPLTPVLFALALSLLLAISYRSISEKNSKQKIRTMLSQYVSPSVLSHIIDANETLNAEIGSSEILTILFSDIRDFTKISEQQEAKNVVDLLNIYFAEMTDIIFEYEGTLDKFIGDAIMSFWGAPLKIETHAEQAVNAAITMRQKLTLVNKTLSLKGYSPIDIGIGIHTGRVILGNIGSAKKLDYTVIGDSVNLASRLEGTTKQYQVSIIISEDTFNDLPDDIPCIIVDLVRVKGKQHPIKILTPANLFIQENKISLDAPTLISQSNKAFEHYQNKQWDDALTFYNQFSQIKLYSILSERISHFSTTPPAQDWDGVYTHTNK